MIRLSKSEEKVLNILKGKGLTLEEIATVFYDDDRYDASNLIGNIVRRIRRKCEFDKKTEWTILDEVFDGNVKIYWIGKKAKKIWKMKK